MDPRFGISTLQKKYIWLTRVFKNVLPLQKLNKLKANANILLIRLKTNYYTQYWCMCMKWECSYFTGQSWLVVVTFLAIYMYQKP